MSTTVLLVNLSSTRKIKNILKTIDKDYIILFISRKENNFMEMYEEVYTFTENNEFYLIRFVEKYNEYFSKWAAYKQSENGNLERFCVFEHDKSRNMKDEVLEMKDSNESYLWNEVETVWKSR